MFHMGWRPISAAPFGEDLWLCVIESGEVHLLDFACRRTKEGWVHAQTHKPVRIRPTHWSLASAPFCSETLRDPYKYVSGQPEFR